APETRSRSLRSKTGTRPLGCSSSRRTRRPAPSRQAIRAFARPADVREGYSVTEANHNEDGIYETVATIDNGTFGTRTIRFETGRLAKQAAGSVVAYLDDDTMLLSATTAGKSPREGFDFFPLTVDVEERMYAAGRIPG